MLTLVDFLFNFKILRLTSKAVLCCSFHIYMEMILILVLAYTEPIFLPIAIGKKIDRE